jgi:hypothetical protein
MHRAGPTHLYLPQVTAVIVLVVFVAVVVVVVRSVRRGMRKP